MSKSSNFYYFVYRTTNLITGLIYVGRHKTKNLNDGYLGSGTIINRALQKYGKQNFQREVIEYCDTEKQLLERECYWIEKLNVIANGYNILNSSTGGDTITNNPNKELICRKISDTLKRKRPWLGKHHSEESKKKSSLKMSGVNNPNYGRTYTKEERLKFGRSGKNNTMYGKHLSKETKRKIGLKSKGRNLGKPSPQKGKHITEEQRLKRMGKNNHMYGKHHSEKTKKLMRRAQLNQTILTCPYCNLQSNNHGNMIKSHFEKCKQNPRKNERQKTVTHAPGGTLGNCSW